MGVHALARHQTREHSDLDLWLSAADSGPFVVAAAELRIDGLTPWPGDRPWSSVVTDGALLRIDLHLHEPVGDSEVHCGSALSRVRSPRAALEGRGAIAGRGVRCESLPWTLRWHQDHAPVLSAATTMQLAALAGLSVPERCARRLSRRGPTPRAAPVARREPLHVLAG